MNKLRKIDWAAKSRKILCEDFETINRGWGKGVWYSNKQNETIDNILFKYKYRI